MMFFQGNNDLRSLLLAHLVTEGGSGVRLFTSYTRPILEMLDIDVTGLKDKDEKHQSLQTADGINLLDRNIPPQDRNTNIMMREFQQSLEQGMTPGFSGRDWWKVGSSTSNDAKSSTNNSNSMTASTSPLTTNESQTTEYWSNGSQSMVKTVVKNTGLSETDLYGDDRIKFLPKSIINLPGENVIIPSRDQLIVDVISKYFSQEDVTTKQSLSSLQGVIFCVDVKHANRLAALLNKHMISAEAVSANSREGLKKYKDGKLRFLCACDLLNEGCDVLQ